MIKICRYCLQIQTLPGNLNKKAYAVCKRPGCRFKALYMMAELNMLTTVQVEELNGMLTPSPIVAAS